MVRHGWTRSGHRGGRAVRLNRGRAPPGVERTATACWPCGAGAVAEFTGALQRVAEQVLADPPAARATIVELAERSGTSPATITRFCRALGFEGYADLRPGHRRRDRPRPPVGGWTVDIGREIQPSDPLERVLGQIMAADTQAMHEPGPAGPRRGRAGRGRHRRVVPGGHLRCLWQRLVGARCSSGCTASA